MVNDWIIYSAAAINGLSNKYMQFSKGTHYKTKKHAILKVILPFKGKCINYIKLAKELNIMMKLKHDNIAQLMEFDTNAQLELDRDFYEKNHYDHDHCVLYVLQSIHQCTLYDAVKCIGDFNEYATRSYLIQFVGALEAIHDLDIIQYEIKLDQHCLLDEYFRLKMIIQTDFEQQDKKKSRNIFDLGVILFTMYGGFPPFHTKDAVNDWWWNKFYCGNKYIVASEKPEHEHDRDKCIRTGIKKIALFWKAHERTKIFSANLKNLIQGMMHPFHKFRYTLNDIKNHTWYEGESYNELELKQYTGNNMSIM